MSLPNLRFVSCSRNLDMLRTQRIIGFLILITHKSTGSENHGIYSFKATASFGILVKYKNAPVFFIPIQLLSYYHTCLGRPMFSLICGLARTGPLS